MQNLEYLISFCLILDCLFVTIHCGIAFIMAPAEFQSYHLREEE